MKTFLLSLLLSFAVFSASPHSARADTVKFLCSDGNPPSKQMTIARIEQNPGFIAAMKKDRKFDPSKKGTTGTLDTINIVLTPPCTSGFDVQRSTFNTDGVLVGSDSLGLSFELLVDNKSVYGKQRLDVADPNASSASPSLSFKWESFPANPGSRSSFPSVPLDETVITALGQKKQFKIKVAYDTVAGDPPNQKLSAEKVVPMDKNLCVQVYGSGDKGIVGMRGKSRSLRYEALGDIIEIWRIDGMEKIDPFRKYQDKFSYFVDLKNHDDKLWYEAVDKNLKSVIGLNEFNKILGDMKNISSCKDASVYGFFSAPVAQSSNIQGISTLGHKAFMLKTSAIPEKIIHEMGHAIGRLMDERVDTTVIPPAFVRNTNCTINPDKDYVYGGKMYGGKVVGCATGERTTNGATVYRSTYKSIINDDAYSPRFNVVSCGYILKRILGNKASAKSYFPECATLDTEK